MFQRCDVYLVMLTEFPILQFYTERQQWGLIIPELKHYIQIFGTSLFFPIAYTFSDPHTKFLNMKTDKLISYL